MRDIIKITMLEGLRKCETKALVTGAANKLG